MVDVKKEAVDCGSSYSGAGCARHRAAFNMPHGWDALDGNRFGGLTGEKIGLK